MSLNNIQRYLRHGSLPQLAVFEACARLGSFTQAAEELHMAQPTVSMQIKKLSEVVGLPLFEQVGKRMYLTESGIQLLTMCRDVFDAISRAEEGLSNLRGLRSGCLRLAAITACQSFAPRMLAEFAELYPGVDVTLQIYNQAALVNRITRNQHDLYLFAGDVRDLEVVHQTILYNPMVVFARDDHPLRNTKKISFSRFAQEPFLMRERGSGTRKMVLDVFQEYGCEARVRMELGGNEAIKQAILAGQGVAVLPRDHFGLEGAQRGLVALDVEGFPLPCSWSFVYPQGKQPSVAARAFMDFVRGRAKALVAARSGEVVIDEEGGEEERQIEDREAEGAPRQRVRIAPVKPYGVMDEYAV